MKNYLNIAVLLLFVLSNTVYSQKTNQKRVVLPESKYFNFQSNQILNAHLFLYNRAMSAKFKKTPNDSLVYSAFKDKVKGVAPKDIPVLNSVIEFYRDSLLSKDLLFDSLMRDFSDKLISGNSSTVKWQTKTLEKLNVFIPYFSKLFWVEIETANKNWLVAHQTQLIKLESVVVPELERIYQTKLPEGKIRVDLVDYATWAGAYSFNDKFCHVVFSSSHRSNQGDLASEVVFHETSHFLVDKLSQQIAKEAKGKDVKTNINLWHNMIFYTTGYVLKKEFAKEGKEFTPYYEQMKFADKFPDFKSTVEGCKGYWNPYCEAKISMEESVKMIVEYMLTKK